MITDNGTLVRIAVDDVSVMGRNTQGVRLIRLTRGEKLVEIEKIEVLASEESNTAESAKDSGDVAASDDTESDTE